jgi:hypothetical protein
VVIKVTEKCYGEKPEHSVRRLLRKKLRDEYAEEVAAHLVRTLEYTPLAITQAAAYIL